jgi:hypothetical protein
MATDVTLMVLPGQAGGDGGGLPQILWEQKGIWRDLSSHEPRDVAQISRTLDGRLKHLMTLLAQTPGADVWPTLRALCWKQLYESLVPIRLREVLRAAADAAPAAAAPADVPILRIHTLVDWLPWELMHDEVDFLGLRFRIARLPIGPNTPDLDGQDHQVRRIYNLLARNLFTAAELFSQWQQTFAPLLAPAVQEVRFPAGASNGDDYPTLGDLENAVSPDILHITCHGGEVDTDDGKVYWTLDHKAQFYYSYRIKADNVEMLEQMTNIFGATRPLVFGNACASAKTTAGDGAGSGPGLVPGFGPLFLAQGAAAFVGTFVPITEALSVRFAREFYRRLLHDGLPIGQALWATKKFFRDEGGNDPSYLFYCLYGLPDTRFQLASA